MAKESVITKERVRAAAEKLRAEGRRVSVRPVRAEMGEGSHATVGPLLNEVKAEWKQESEMAAKLAEANLPTDILAGIHRYVSREREAVRETMSQEQDDLRVQVEDAEEAYREAQDKFDELQAQIESERVAVVEKIRALDIACARQAEKAAATEEALRHARSERDAVRQEKETLSSDNTQLQLELKRSDQSVQEARGRITHLETLVESLQNELSGLAQRAAVADRHAADTEALCGDLKQRCQSLETDCRELQGEHRATTARLLEAQKQLAEVQQRAMMAEHQVLDTEADNAELKKRCQSLETNCRDLQSEHRTMTSRLLEMQTALAEARQPAATAAAIVDETPKAKKPIAAPSAAKAAQAKAKPGNGVN
jgi:colicin import membrane protein